MRTDREYVENMQINQQIYVLDDREMGTVKIGCSRTPKDRQRALSKALGREIILAYMRTTEVDAFRAENAIHRSLQEHRVAREWFTIPVETAIAAVDRELNKRCA